MVGYVLPWLTVALVVFGSLGAYAADGSLDSPDIRGVVIDATTDQPIEGAVVIVRDTALQAVTDEHGRFRVVNRSRPSGPNYGVPLAAGTYTLEVRAAGYFPVLIDGVTTGDEDGLGDGSKATDGDGGSTDHMPLVIRMKAGHETNFVQVGPSGRYFVHEDGSPYVPAGFHHQIVEPDFNLAWYPWDKLGSWWSYHPARAEAYARNIAARGISMIRIFLEEAYILEGNRRWALFQDPVGIYNPSVVAHWDRLFDWADQYGFKILVSVYHTDQAQRNWRYYPYSQQQGGPAGERPDREWFVSPAIKEAQKRDFEYVIDRWGQRDSLFALDLMNEADGWPGAALYLGPWIQEMATHVRDYMIKRWGKAHLLTVSAADHLARSHRNTIINNPHLDFVNTHMYIGSIANPQVQVGGVIKTDVFTPALEASYTAMGVLDQMSEVKPYFDSEHGPIAAQLPLDRFYVVNGNPSSIVDEFYFHNIIWANFVSGAAGVATRWGFRPNTPLGYRLTDAMLDDIGRLRRFALSFDLNQLSPRPVRAIEIDKNRSDLFVVGSIDDEQGMFWALKQRRPIPDEEELRVEVADADPDTAGTTPDPAVVRGGIVTVPVNSDGLYRISFYDTRSGDWREPRTVESKDSRLTIELPEFRWDIAWMVERMDL